MNNDAIGPEFDIVCALSGAPAELFTRNPQQRLVPLTRSSLDQMRESQKNLETRLANQTWKPFEYVEISLEDGKEEYSAQIPNPQEQKRRDFARLLKSLVVEVFLCSSRDFKTDQVVANYLGDRSSLDFVLSELRDYPNKGAKVVLVANMAVNSQQMKELLDFLDKNPVLASKAAMLG